MCCKSTLGILDHTLVTAAVAEVGSAEAAEGVC